jgi:hypothetical protein
LATAKDFGVLVCEQPCTRDPLRELVRLYESWPKPEEAEKWRAKLAPYEPAKEAAKTEATD